MCAQKSRRWHLSGLANRGPTIECALAESGWQFGIQTIIHSNHGCQYTSTAYRQCFQRYRLQLSRGRVRTCADNSSAVCVCPVETRVSISLSVPHPERSDGTHQSLLLNGIQPMTTRIEETETRKLTHELQNKQVSLFVQKVTKNVSPKTDADPSHLLTRTLYSFQCSLTSTTILKFTKIK